MPLIPGIRERRAFDMFADWDGVEAFVTHTNLYFASGYVAVRELQIDSGIGTHKRWKRSLLHVTVDDKTVATVCLVKAQDMRVYTSGNLRKDFLLKPNQVVVVRHTFHGSLAQKEELPDVMPGSQIRLRGTWTQELG